MASSSVQPQTITYVGGLTLFHQWEFFRHGTGNFPRNTKVVYYLTPHFSQGSHESFEVFRWGQSLADWPPYSRPRMETILSQIKADPNNYMPFLAVKIWCDQVLGDMKNFGEKNPLFFELHFCKIARFEAYNVQKPTKATLTYIEEGKEETKNANFDLSQQKQLITGVKSLRKPTIFPSFLNFQTYAPDFFQRNPLPTGSPLNDLPIILVGAGPSTMWLVEILKGLHIPCYIVGLDLQFLPKNPRNKEIVADIKGRPAEFQLPQESQTFRVGDLKGTLTPLQTLFAPLVFDELKKRGLDKVVGNEDLAAVFAKNVSGKFVFHSFCKVVLCSGFNSEAAFPEGTAFYNSFNPVLEDLQQDIVPEDARGSVAHQLLKLDYLYKKKVQVGIFLDTLALNAHVHRLRKLEFIMQALQLTLPDVNEKYFEIVQTNLNMLPVQQKLQSTPEEVEMFFVFSYQQHVADQKLSESVMNERILKLKQLLGITIKFVPVQPGSSPRSKLSMFLADFGHK